MKNTPENLATLAKIAAACEGTRWEFRYQPAEKYNWIHTQMRVRWDAPKGTPIVFFDDELEASGSFKILVQIEARGYTSDGALSIAKIRKVSGGLIDAARLVNQIADIVTAAGLQVSSDIVTV